MSPKVQKIIRNNWKKTVKHVFKGNSLTELKSCVKEQIHNEVTSYNYWRLNTKPELKPVLSDVWFEN